MGCIEMINSWTRLFKPYTLIYFDELGWLLKKCLQSVLHAQLKDRNQKNKMMSCVMFFWIVGQ